MPWKESGPPKQSNYGIALRRMYSAEKLFKNKDCFEIVDQEVQKLVDQGFVIKVASDNIDHDQPEWYLRLQAVFTPEKSRQVRLVFDSSCKGYHGLSLNDHLEKGLNYINSLPNVLIAWRWDEVAYAGDIRRCSTNSTRIVSRKVTTVRLIPEQIYLLLDTILDLRKKEENISERVILESIESDISQPPLEDVDEGEAYTKKKTDAMKAVRKVLRHIVEQRLETKMKRVTVMDNAEEEDV
ncbi:hypothetical protein AWC38_SpisGene8672 [Stylophora pistillata]|uniref:Uncharacterized protein n=1 Tax=Stylophora pistillata TaxID=50429 RepID=A0A2B4SCT0_STYPI|nr:hypothetical protein AWC38_SpisGene8672 [Stylophora pistillata]